MRLYERAGPGQPWREVSPRPQFISFGLCGLAWGRGLHGSNLGDGGELKKEGDVRSPAGVFGLGTRFGFADRPPGAAATLGADGQTTDYLKVTQDIQCVEDASSKSYNTVVDRNKTTVDWKGEDRMGDPKTRGKLFKWGVVVDQNPDHVPGGGSCVFIHIWKAPGSGTAACTAGDEGTVRISCNGSIR